MVGPLKKSPIDTLLKKNIKMAESTTDGARRPMIHFKAKSHYMLTRSKRFGRIETTYLKSQDRENNIEISMIEDSLKMNNPRENEAMRIEENDDHVKKERLLERLRYLGLAPRNHANKCSSSSASTTANKRKHPAPKRIFPQDDDNFVQPRVFECDYCPMLFFNKIVFRRHIIKHLRIRRCGNCGKPFKCTVSLRRHQAHCKKILF